MAQITQTPESAPRNTDTDSQLISFGEDKAMPLPPVPGGDLDTLSRSLLIAELDSEQTTAAERGIAAYQQSLHIKQESREQALQRLVRQNDSKTHRRLYDMARRSANAVQVLSVVGYDALRNLHSSGLLYADIARDLDVNLNDLLSFMRQHPAAVDDAKADAETCADAQTAELMYDLKQLEFTGASDSQVKLAKIRMDLQVELNKRLSGRWAQREDALPDTGTKASEFNVHIHGGTPRSGPRVVNSDSDDSGRDTEHERSSVASANIDQGTFSMKIGADTE